MKRSWGVRISRFFKVFFLKFIRIDDSPQRIALGFGLGVFSGILPGTGPIAALILAALFRVNRAAALLGSLLTNTWFSIVTIVLSIKLGSVIMGSNWEDVYAQWQFFLRQFQWRNFLEASFLQIAVPVAAGYFLIAFLCAAVSYLLMLTALVMRKRYEDKNRTGVSR
ncbi:MAG: DUF2062 domain-containing protein [Candidatus Omnitrophica bacterium]|nr:DUF2062 domain-containing protein [Candidatus Omnitrophota bacterium]